jgi:hypothetical protein
MNYFNTPYQPIMPTYNNSANLFFVGSEEEAKSWIVNPSQTVYLLDRNNSKLYIKSVEKNGMVQPIEVFELSMPSTNELNNIEYATKQDIEELSKKIKEIENEHNEHHAVGTTSAE